MNKVAACAPPEPNALRPSHVCARAGVDLDRFAFLDEKRHVNGLAGFELFSVDLDQLDFVGGTEADVRAFTRVDVTDNSLHECSQIPRRAMMDFEHNGGIAMVFDGHSSA